VFRLSISVFLTFHFIASIALVPSLKIVVLTCRAHPASIWKLILLRDLFVGDLLLGVFPKRFFLWQLDGGWPIAWDEVTSPKLVDLMLLVVRVHKLIQIL
jgi:hypothetical protein